MSPFETDACAFLGLRPAGVGAGPRVFARRDRLLRITPPRKAKGRT
jgi:hypothetical protein